VNRWRSAPALMAGIRSFECGATRSAHEEWEDAWRAHGGTPLGELARALSQWAAACVHLESGRESGFRSLAAKSARRLALAEIDEQFDTDALATWIALRATAVPAPDPVALRSLCD